MSQLLSESRWFAPEKHMAQLRQFMKKQVVEQNNHLLDLFGASQAVSRCWRNEGFNAIVYDIKVNRDHDICSQSGFKILLGMAMTLHV